MMKCDPVTGACLLPDQDQPDDSSLPAKHKGLAVRYIGDPMCSWCWGISPTVRAIEVFCEAQSIEFSITMGGLRAGGGELWNPAFKDFLRNEWQHIAEITGQPFGFTLLEAAHFDYGTEPACRAVATVKLLQVRDVLPASIVLAFFSAVQHKFYVAGQDPKTVDYYASICASLSLDFDQFRTVFDSPEALHIRQFLSELIFPLYFFDYETFSSAVPLLDGTSPHKHFPVQYSLHILDADGSLHHKEYLERQARLPDRLVERMQEDFGPTGSVVSWHASFEKTRNREMTERYPGAYSGESDHPFRLIPIT